MPACAQAGIPASIQTRMPVIMLTRKSTCMHTHKPASAQTNMHTSAYTRKYTYPHVCMEANGEVAARSDDANTSDQEQLTAKAQISVSLSWYPNDLQFRSGPSHFCGAERRNLDPRDPNCHISLTGSRIPASIHAGMYTYQHTYKETLPAKRSTKKEDRAASARQEQLRASIHASMPASTHTRLVIHRSAACLNP